MTAPQRPVRVALAQIGSVPGDIVENLRTLADAAIEASELGADLLITPELFATGYDPTVAASSAGIGAGLRQELAALAAQVGIAIVASTPEQTDHGDFITATLFDADGTELLHHRKTRLYGRERKHFTAGSEPSGIAGVAGLRIGLAICYEIEFTDCARDLAIRGADLIAVPTALEVVPDPGIVTEQVPRVLVPARAIENQVVVGYADHCAPGFVGLGVIAGPAGPMVAAQGGGRQLVVADVDPRALARSRELNPYVEEMRRGPGGAA